MQEGRPSRTAVRVAMLRAAHQLFDRPLVFDDPVAVRILDPQLLERVQANRRGGRIVSYLRAFLVVRSRYAEDQLALAISRGVRQYVILGAGLDTFAYRNRSPDSVRVFEVDRRATQAWKRAILERQGIAVPAGMTFIEADFDRDDVRTILGRGGVDLDQPVFFAWLGVTQYLKREAIIDTLSFIANLPAGTTVVFDYSISPSALNLFERVVFHTMALRVAAMGEPWTTTFVPDALMAELRSLGFSECIDRGASELNADYFGDRRDGLCIGSLARIASARV